MTEQVKIESQDGKVFTVDMRIAEMSMTLKNLIEDVGAKHTIPMPNITGKILTKVVEYCQHHVGDIRPQQKKDDDLARLDDIVEWDREFCKVDQCTLFELVLASNYLELSSLLDLCCKTIALQIRGKTADQIRAHFNLPNDFTPEEYEQVRKENEWCEEV